MKLGPNLKHFLPRRLFARTILIILLPLLLAQAVAAYVFYDRHFTTLSTRLAQTTAADIDLLAEQATETPAASRDALFKRWEDATGLSARFTTNGASSVGAADYLRRTLGVALASQGIADYRFGAVDENNVVLYLPAKTATPQASQKTELAVRIPMRRLYTSTTLIFVLWMVGAAAALVIVSLIFMRNQIRPIRRLAEAAEQFGRSIDDAASDKVRPFKPEGAREVRQAAAAFLVMRNRLRRMIEQRTAMLATISHDLRTPLTRMRLQLALTPQTPDTDALGGDITEMEKMIESYLAFARGQDSEPAVQVDLTQLVGAVAQQSTRLGKPVWWQAPKDAAQHPLRATLRPAAITRALNNLITNALKFGDAVWIAVIEGDYTVEIAVEDNGPGIPPEARETVFKPFFQLDSELAPDPSGAPRGFGAQPQSFTPSFAQSYGAGYGMGLTIARDIARAHGGDVILDQSPHGGLKAVLRLPV